MRFSPFFRRAFRITRFRSDVERDVHDELDLHLELMIEALMDEGLSQSEAERRAHLQFGNRRQVAAECIALSAGISRRRRRLEWFGTWFSDLKGALRDVMKHPGHYAAVSLTLGLALALATAVFSVVYGVLLKPLPFAEPDRVMSVFGQHTKGGLERLNNSAKEYVQRRDGMETFESVALLTRQTRSIGEPGAVQRTFSLSVTPSFFDVLGLEPAVGRFLDPKQEKPGHAPEVVISYRLWRQLFELDSAVVGETLKVEGQSHQIVGVTPEGFAFPGWDAGIFLPQVLDESVPPEAWYYANFEMMARLRPGATPAQAQAEMDALTQRVLEQLPAELRTRQVQNGYRAVVVGFHQDLTREVRHWLFLLLAGAGFLLLVAAFSLSNLQWVHTAARHREIATHYALGAGRGRILRRLFVECSVPTVLGALLGIGGGNLALRWWLTHFQTWEIPRIDQVGLGAVELTVLVAAALAAMMPAISVGAGTVGRADLFSIMRQGASTETRSAARGRGLLVAGQTAGAVVLLAGAVLMIVTLRNLLAVDLGFETRSVHAAAVSLAQSEGYETRWDKWSFLQNFLDEARSVPGVEAVTLASRLPFSEWNETSSLTLEGRPRGVDEVAAQHHQTVVERDFFRTVGIEIQRGRGFEIGDDRQAPRVLVVSEALAERYWPDQSPLGERVHLGPRREGEDPTWWTVIGVVDEVVQERLTERPLGAFYVPFSQAPRGFTRLLVRTEPGYRGPVIGDLQQRLADLDPGLALFWVTTLEESVDSSLIAYRLPMQFLSIYALIALALAAVGVFGVLARSVSLRSREIGIRLALGSSRAEICRSTMAWLAGFLILGWALGLGASLFLCRWLESLFYGVEPSDPRVLTAVTLVVVAMSLAAAAVPAVRACRVDPIRVLSSE